MNIAITFSQSLMFIIDYAPGCGVSHLPFLTCGSHWRQHDAKISILRDLMVLRHPCYYSPR
jgi:hypothetical protein